MTEKITATLMLDTSKFGDALEGLLRDTKTSMQGLQTEFNGLATSWEKLGGKAGKLAGTIGTAFEPLKNIGGRLMGLANDARGVDKSLSSTFGGNVKTIKDWSKTYGEAIGRNENTLAGFASKVGEKLAAAGLSGEELASKTQSLSAGLLDIGAIKGLNDEEAMAAGLSLLEGNQDAINKLGVRGIETGKVLSNMGAILSDANGKTGAAAETANDFANKQIALTGASDAFGASIGNTLLPAMTRLIELKIKLLEMTQNLPAGLQVAGAAVGGVASQADSMLLSFMAFKSIKGQLGEVAEAGSGFGGKMKGVFGSIGTAIKTGLMGALRLAGIAFAALTSPIGIAVAAIVGIGVLMYTFRDQIADALKPVGQFFYNYIFKPLDQVVSFVVKKMASMLSWVVDKVSGAAKFFGKDELAAGLDGFSEKLDDFSKKKAPLLETTAVKVADGMRNAGKGAAEMMDVLAKKASDTLGGVKDDMDGVTEGAGEADTAIANTAAKAEESGLGDCKPCDGETGIEEAGVGDTDVGEAVSDQVMPEAPAMTADDPNADPNAEGGDQNAEGGAKLGPDGKPLSPIEETDEKRKSVLEQIKLDKDKWKGLLGNTEKGAKAIRAVESAEAVKSIITSTAKSIGKAMELGFPLAIPAAAAAAATGAAQLATIKGQFHDGIDSVPRTGSYLLEGGERVLDRRLNSDLKDYLSRGANTHNNSVNVDMHFDASMDPDTAYRNQEKLKEAMEDLFREHVLPSPFGHYR